MAVTSQHIKDWMVICEILGGCSDSASASGLRVLDEDLFVLSGVDTLNFIGTDVIAQDSGITGQVNIYIPPPTFVSHWNTSDGSNGSQAVSESISRTLQRIATPSGGEGSPFRTNGWAGTNQSATTSTSVTFTTPGDTTGFGGDSTMVVRVYNASGTLIDSYTTPAITANNVHTSASGDIVVTITNYATDTSKFKANASVAVDIDTIFTGEGENGGRYYVEVDHITDTATDAAQTFSYAQTDVFYDTNPTTPSIGGTVSIQEDSGSVLTKHISGIEYYILNSQFDATVSGIDQMMRNTARTSGNLRVRGTDFGLPTVEESPFGAPAGVFTGWVNDHDVDDIDWDYDGWAITDTSYRYFGDTATIDGLPRDGWASGVLETSANNSILVDTYLITSNNRNEYFDDEDRRFESDYTTPWDSTVTLGAGEALVMNGQLMVPDQSTLVGDSSASNTDWTTYKPDLNGTNPDYSSLSVGAGVDYYRVFPADDSDYHANMTIVFAGTFNGANALTDLANGDLEVTVRKIDGIGQSGPSSNPLFMHGVVYNSGTFDDGATDGQIRLSSSSGNTIQCTFGTFTMKDGIYVQIRIKHADIKLNSIQFTYN